MSCLSDRLIVAVGAAGDGRRIDLQTENAGREIRFGQQRGFRNAVIGRMVVVVAESAADDAVRDGRLAGRALRATIAPMAPAFVAVALGLSRIMPYCSQRSIVPEWYSETMPPKPM